MRVFALLPAAGVSSRMGRPKLTLPLGGRTVLEHVIDALRAAHVSELLVVLGPHVAELKALAEKAGAKVLLLERPTTEMRATIEHGLNWLEHNLQPNADDAFLLLPSDHPTLAPDVIALLTRTAAADASKSIFVPTYNGKRGHPALIGWNHAPGIRALSKDHGLNTYLRSHAADTDEIPCEFAEILCDLDTPEDYQRLLGIFGP